MKSIFRTIVGSAIFATVGLIAFSGVAQAVDGVVLITQGRAFAGNVTPGDAPGFPVTISRPGSYRLAGNLTHLGFTACTAAGGNPSTTIPCVFDITSDGVTLDLNGFTIDTVFTANGVNALGQSDIEVLNGVVRDAEAIGIAVGPNSRVQGIRSINNDNVGGGAGIIAQGNCTIVDNIISDGGTIGIFVLGDGCTINGNTLNNNLLSAIEVRGAGCLVSDNTITNNGAGIVVSETCTITNNALSNNGGIGIVARSGPSPSSSGTLVLSNTVRGHSFIGLDLGTDVGYADNVLTNNATNVSGGVEIGTNLCGNNTTCP